jgi:acid phosphatase
LGRLADNFFQAEFGGSFLNHFQLVCACTPVYPNAKSPAKILIAAVEPNGASLTLAPNSPKSAMHRIQKFVNNGTISPDSFAVNTMRSPYQPCNNKPAQNGDPRFTDPELPNTLPPQYDITIGNLLSLRVRSARAAGVRCPGCRTHRERHPAMGDLTAALTF